MIFFVLQSASSSVLNLTSSSALFESQVLFVKKCIWGFWGSGGGDRAGVGRGDAANYRDAKKCMLAIISSHCLLVFHPQQSVLGLAESDMDMMAQLISRLRKVQFCQGQVFMRPSTGQGGFCHAAMNLWRSISIAA